MASVSADQYGLACSLSEAPLGTPIPITWRAPAGHPAKDWIGISMGAFDVPTGTHTELHIFVAEKGDYYEITDGLPQYPQSMNGND